MGEGNLAGRVRARILISAYQSDHTTTLTVVNGFADVTHRGGLGLDAGSRLGLSATKIDIFVPASDDMIRMCAGPCGEAKPASAFPTITGRPGVRLAECSSCRHQGTKAQRDQFETVPSQTEDGADSPDAKYFPAGGRRQRAARERQAIVDAVCTVVTAHPNEAITIPQIYEEVFDSVDFVPSEATVRTAVRDLTNDDERFVKVAREIYSWAPDGNAPPPPTPAHVVQMIELRWSGRTPDEIGKEFGVTRERVRQLMKKYGGPDAAEVRRVQAERAEAEALTRANAVTEAVRGALTASGPVTAEDVASHTGLDNADVARFWPQDLAHLRLWATGNYETRWSDDEILAALREAAVYEFPLTTNAYTDLLALGQINGPSMPRIWQRFGSWTAACDAAGVVAGPTMRDHYQSKWSEHDLVQIVQRYLLDPNAPNSGHRFDGWKRENLPDGPSFQTIRNRFGSWTAAKQRALAPGGVEDE